MIFNYNFECGFENFTRNLSSSGLTGNIAAAIQNLTQLEKL